MQLSKQKQKFIKLHEILSRLIGKLCFSKTHASMSYDEYGLSIITKNTVPITAKHVNK